MTRVLGLVGGPEAGGRTTTAVAGVLAGASDRGAETELLELSETALPAVVEAIDGVDAVVFGSPVYRATHSALLKGVLGSAPPHSRRGRRGPPHRSHDGVRAHEERGAASRTHRPQLPDIPGRCRALRAPAPGSAVSSTAFAGRRVNPQRACPLPKRSRTLSLRESAKG
jgi:hypothetical protein